jgi:hypothetical protein
MGWFANISEEYTVSSMLKRWAGEKSDAFKNMFRPMETP